jgi:hypothetical protein
MQIMDVRVGELREWQVTVKDRAGLPVRLDGSPALTLEVVLISRATGLRVLGLTSAAGITHAADQAATPGLALVTVTPEQTALFAPGALRVITWVLAAGANPQVGDDTVRLRVLAALRAA